MHGALLKPGVHLASEFVTLDFLFTYGKQAHPWSSMPESSPIINLSHDGELHEMLGLGVHIRAHVQQNGHTALGVREWGRQGHAIYGLQRSQKKSRDRKSVVVGKECR